MGKSLNILTANSNPTIPIRCGTNYLVGEQNYDSSISVLNQDYNGAVIIATESNPGGIITIDTNQPNKVM